MQCPQAGVRRRTGGARRGGGQEPLRTLRLQPPELYGIVRVEGIQSFAELLAKHGRGHVGCDICKPTVGSILASCWNQPITDPALIPLQDTNDTFMANMQKNGTYSVVPRILVVRSPRGLIAIGGGEEIRPLHQDHWRPAHRPVRRSAARTAGHLGRADRRRLRDRPRHGKSLRTVKSCVGSTRCRYGVQDSVSMALRPRTVTRACVRAQDQVRRIGLYRECAEAQAKDIGVIATDRGWNLYICGNGVRPRHAELFATDPMTKR